MLLLLRSKCFNVLFVFNPSPINASYEGNLSSVSFDDDSFIETNNESITFDLGDEFVIGNFTIKFLSHDMTTTAPPPTTTVAPTTTTTTVAPTTTSSSVFAPPFLTSLQKWVQKY